MPNLYKRKKKEKVVDQPKPKLDDEKSEVAVEETAEEKEILVEEAETSQQSCSVKLYFSFVLIQLI